MKTFKCQAKKDEPKANTRTNPSNSKEDSLVAFMLKKLKIETKIQQMEYERAMQSRRSRSQETRCDRPRTALGGKAPEKRHGAESKLTTPKWPIELAPENKVDAEDKLTSRRHRRNRTQWKAAPSYSFYETLNGKTWAPLASR